MRLTLRVILQTHFPEKNGMLSDEDFGSISVMKLNDQSISYIDNLELFHEIEELHLKNNNLKTIDNIELLQNLWLLDVANNQIEDEALLSAVFPRSLKRLIISGNPCAESTSAVEKLQARHPQLEIVTTAEKCEEILESSSNLPPESVPVESEYSQPEVSLPHSTSKPSESFLTPSGTLDPAAVLREVVDRKCRLQSYSQFDLNATIKELDSEYSRAVSRIEQRQRSIHSNPPSPARNGSVIESGKDGSLLVSCRSRIDSLKTYVEESNRKDGTDDFITKLRTRALEQQYKKIHKDEVKSD
eukprot:CAMPEP_0185020592 /NCGR_PEP_ID=MMETSP1103-20130426/3210_1 /TAXON_ID=36769 /ORGANISM="Paraphysomonas bandaiensis, Strain Caron Lab Isolate" /LENGTH=300 /DNA_ID=CAMNT_0027551587 /DNA_START=89 /DNA_END=988 /DNA_ORIENTATION=-